MSVTFSGNVIYIYNRALDYGGNFSCVKYYDKANKKVVIHSTYGDSESSRVSTTTTKTINEQLMKLTHALQIYIIGECDLRKFSYQKGHYFL